MRFHAAMGGQAFGMLVVAKLLDDEASCYADPDSLRGNPGAMHSRDEVSLSRGHLAVVDRRCGQGTGSASEEFAATLQDNSRRLIVGESTVGAGCGHTDGGTPTS